MFALTHQTVDQSLLLFRDKRAELCTQFEDWYLTLNSGKKDREALVLVLGLREFISELSSALLEMEMARSMALSVVIDFLDGTAEQCQVH